MPATWRLRCADCGGNALAPNSLGSVCPRCGGGWLDPHYDYTAIADGFTERVARRGRTMWRYHELLPLADDSNRISMGEGGTPLLRLRNLGLMLGSEHLYVKDERQGPTGSFKDRQASLAISAMKEQGVREAVVASTGNVAIAYSAYATQAGLKLWAFLTSAVPADKMREVALYGTEVVKVTATYDRTKQVAAQFAARKGLHLDRGIRSVAAREAMKTLAYEIAEELGAQEGGGWRAPDWYVQAVSGGMGPVGVLRGFEELHEMGLIDRIPRIAAVQVEGCAPMVRAWQQGLESAPPVSDPRTRIATVATGDPGIAYTILQRAARSSGGSFVAVSDEEAFRAMHIMAKIDGLSMEPAAAMAFAATIRLIREGTISPDERVVICCSGHTFPVEKHLLDEEWGHDLDLSHEAASARAAPSEGLLASLESLGRDVGRIAIIEDDPGAAQLLRRILQAQGNYEVMEATDGLSGLKMIRRDPPDLILLDLMMPGMDGYALIEALKEDPRLEPIPVIVITASSLSGAERTRLQGHVRSLLRKGSFVDSELLDDIARALE